MTGNCHVRFLGGKGLARALPYPVMKKCKLYIIVTVVVVVVFVMSLVATSTRNSLERYEAIAAAVDTVDDRIRSAINADPNCTFLEHNALPAEPNHAYVGVLSGLGHIPQEWQAALNLPQRWDERLTKIFPRKIVPIVDVLVHNATLEEMSQIRKKMKAIEHLYEIPIRVGRTGPFRDQPKNNAEGPGYP